MAVCIAGMHRSGTSMVARALNVCGLYLGPKDELMEPGIDNPDGFWENLRFVEVNDAVLNQLGGGWDWPSWKLDWADEKLAYSRSQARQLVKAFDDFEPWGWKDPRNSLTLPFWRDVVRDMRVVISLRNPLEVAFSLSNRNSSSYALGLTLWLAYNERALEATTPGERIVTHYDAYFHDPESEARRVLAFLGIEANDEGIDTLSTVVSPQRRKNQSSIQQLVDAHVSNEIVELYLAMCEEAGWTDTDDGPSRNTLEGDSEIGRQRALTIASGLQPRPAGANGGVEEEEDLQERVVAASAGRIEKSALTPVSVGRELVQLRTQLAQHEENIARSSSEQDARFEDLIARLEALSDAQTRLHADLSEAQTRLHMDLAEARAELIPRETVIGESLRELRAEMARREGDDQNRYDALVADSARREASFRGVVKDLAKVLLEEESPEAEARFRAKQLHREIEAAVATLPLPGTVVVISKGDPDLLRALDGRTGWHFPPGEDGGYAGYYPATSTAAIAQLEALRAKGADYLLIPAPSLWWLEHYRAFRHHLERNYPTLVSEPELGVIIGLKESTVPAKLAWCGDVEAMISEFERRFDRDPAILDWNTGTDLASLYPHLTVFSPTQDDSILPYLDGSVDVVAIGSEDLDGREEAARVAAAAVLTIGPAGRNGDSLDVAVEWKAAGRSKPPPSVTVLIPSYNGIEHTERCVIRLGETLAGDYDVEILVVDDCSTDDTQERLIALGKVEPRLRVLRNLENLGFLATNNRGAEEARGDMLVLLNNDTLPMPNWLPPLLRVFDHYPDTGAVAGKLIYPDGTLQEAGGIIFSDGRAANFGKWEVDAEHPLFNYVREVDYGSAALLATKRALWLEVGGFDTRYRPIYCEDSDYCFKLREHGYRVYYQPESVVIHVEGATSGTDESSGDKRYQVRNREQLAEKWRDVLKRQPPYPSRFDYETLHAIAVRDEGGW